MESTAHGQNQQFTFLMIAQLLTQTKEGSQL
jgi:hypothetical protein